VVTGSTVTGTGLVLSWPPCLVSSGAPFLPHARRPNATTATTTTTARAIFHLRDMQ
jgi:hypothetical protein